MEKEKDGVWRTIRGRRIFIGKGESLGEAMSKSGKFNRSDIREAKAGLSQKDKFDRTNSQSLKQRQKAIKDFRKKDTRYSNSVYTTDRKDEKNRINENAHIEGSGQTRVQRNWNKYSEADRREHRHELIQKKLADYRKKKGIKTSITSEEYNKRMKDALTEYGKTHNYAKYTEDTNNIMDNYTTPRMNKEQVEKSNKKAIADYKAKKQSNNKIEKLGNSDEDKEIKGRISELQREIASGRNDKEKTERLKEELSQYEQKYGKQSNNKVNDREFKASMGEVDIPDDFEAQFNDYARKREEETKYPRAQGATKFEDLGLDIKDKKAFSDYLQDKYGTDDFRIINFDNKENAKQIYQEFRDKQAYDTRQEEGLDKFIQHTDMYGGTREYSNEDLKRMEENGIRPMAHSYTGGGWEGVNSNLHLDTKDQAKRITDAVKKKYPDVKVARKTNLFSGGSSIDFNIMSSDKDLFVSDKDIDKMGYEDLHDVSRSNGFEWWAKDNIPNYNNNAGFTIDDVRKYAKESLNQRKQSDIQSVRGNEWYLSDYGKKVVSDLNKEANSYTYNDSDGMVDYFDHGTYMHISIGKWNKPYQVNESKKIKDYVSKKKSNH